MNNAMTPAEAVRLFEEFLIDNTHPLADGTRVLTMPDVVDLTAYFVEERL